MKNLKCLAVFAYGAVAATSGMANPVPAPGSVDLRRLTAASDVVCRATVMRIENPGVPAAPRQVIVNTPRSANNNAQRVLVRVTRIYKGEPGSSVVEIAIPSLEGFGETGTLQDGAQRLFFLKRGEGGNFVLADPWFGQLAVPKGALANPPADNEPLEKMEADFRAGLGSSSHSEVLLAVERLGQLYSKNSNPDLQRLLPGADPEFRGNILLALLRGGDYTAFDEAANFACDAAGVGGFGYLGSLIASEIGNLSDDRAVPLLLRATKSCSAAVRERAVYALRQLRDPRSVPALAERLSDSYPLARYQAIMALAAIEGRQYEPWGPGLGEFDKDPEKYVSLWRQWWESEGRVKYAASTSNN